MRDYWGNSSEGDKRGADGGRDGFQTVRQVCCLYTERRKGWLEEFLTTVPVSGGFGQADEASASQSCSGEAQVQQEW